VAFAAGEVVAPHQLLRPSFPPSGFDLTVRRSEPLCCWGSRKAPVRSPYGAVYSVHCSARNTHQHQPGACRRLAAPAPRGRGGYRRNCSARLIHSRF